MLNKLPQFLHQLVEVTAWSSQDITFERYWAGALTFANASFSECLWKVERVPESQGVTSRNGSLCISTNRLGQAV